MTTKQIQIGDATFNVSAEIAHALTCTGAAAPAGNGTYADVMTGGGPVLTPSALPITFPTDAPAGSALATIMDPYRALGATTFAIISNDAGFELLGAVIVAPATPVAEGRHTIEIEATSIDGQRARGETILTAIAPAPAMTSADSASQGTATDDGVQTPSAHDPAVMASGTGI